MADIKTKQVTALGYRWTFSENSQLADLERDQMRNRANQLSLVQLKKPSEKAAAYTLLSYFPDICSALESLEVLPVEDEPDDENTPDEDEESRAKKLAERQLLADSFLLDLIGSAQVFLDFAIKVYRDVKFTEIRTLWEAANALNPHWKAESDENPLEGTDVPPDVGGATQEIDSQIGPILAGDNDALEPDSPTLVEAGQKIADFAESKAKKKAS